MDLLTPQLGLLVWNILAFLILFFILKKFAWKPILKSLKERETGIADSLATAERVRAEMAQLKSEKPTVYPALVTDVRNFGFFVDVTGLGMSGGYWSRNGLSS